MGVCVCLCVCLWVDRCEYGVFRRTEKPHQIKSNKNPGIGITVIWLCIKFIFISSLCIRRWKAEWVGQADEWKKVYLCLLSVFSLASISLAVVLSSSFFLFTVRLYWQLKVNIFLFDAWLLWNIVECRTFIMEDCR